MSDHEEAAAQGRDELLRVARELRNRAEQLRERWIPAAKSERDRLVLVGDSGVMEYAASVIEQVVERVAERGAESSVLCKLLADPDTAVLLERFERGGAQVAVDTSWVAITDDEAKLIEELKGDA